MPLMQYDPFQLKAFDAINRDKSILVSAPTGAGTPVRKPADLCG